MQGIEIKGLFGQALLGSIYNTEEKNLFNIVYDSNNQRDFVPSNVLRFPPTENNHNFRIGDKVEVLLQPKETEGMCWTENEQNSCNTFFNSVDSVTASAWWPSIVKARNVDNIAVKLCATIPTNSTPEIEKMKESFDASLELVTLDHVRPRSNLEFGIDLETMPKLSVRIPPNISKFGNVSRVHKKILRYVHGPAIIEIEKCSSDENGTANTSSDIVFYSPEKKVLSEIELLIEDHWKNMRQKIAILIQTNAFKGRRNNFEQVPEKYKDSPVIENFPVATSLLKYCIGSNGSNIRHVRGIQGIRFVNIADPSLYDYLESKDPLAQITIFADTKESALIAREQMEYVRLHFFFPNSFVSRLIGKQTKNINSVINKSKVIHITYSAESNNLNEYHAVNAYVNVVDGKLKTSDTPTTGLEYALFVIIGGRDAVSMAQLILTSQIDNFSEVTLFEAEKEEAMKPRQHSGNVNEKPPPPQQGPNRQKQYGQPPSVHASQNQMIQQHMGMGINNGGRNQPLQRIEHSQHQLQGPPHPSQQQSHYQQSKQSVHPQQYNNSQQQQPPMQQHQGNPNQKRQPCKPHNVNGNVHNSHHLGDEQQAPSTAGMRAGGPSKMNGQESQRKQEQQNKNEQRQEKPSKKENGKNKRGQQGNPQNNQPNNNNSNQNNNNNVKPKSALKNSQQNQRPTHQQQETHGAHD